MQLEHQADRPHHSAVVFLVDGMDLTRFDEMLAAGELPNIRKRFVDGGVRVRDTVTSLPSVTYPNCTSVITGVYPGHHGIMGNFWFERSALKTHYYMTFGTYRLSNNDFIAPTLFEILHDHFTVSIQAHTRRGASQIIDNRTMFGLSWALGKFIYADTYVGLRFKEVAELASKSGRWPSVIFTYYPGVDEMAHRFGSDSEEYGEALHDIDHTVGMVSHKLDELGMGDSVYYVLVTDHSHVPIGEGRGVDMAAWLQENRGVNVRLKVIRSEEYMDRFVKLARYDVVGGLDGDRVVRFYLRGKQGWAFPPKPEEIAAFIQADPPLAQAPGVGMVLMKDGVDHVHVYTANEEARVERRMEGGQPQYRLVNIRGDLLRYRESPQLARLVDEGWHSSREWLAATVRSRHPDFVAQAVEMFDSTHTGEVVLFAAEDWSFDVKQQGGHGSSLPRDMFIPLFFAGADLPHGAEIGPARIVDVTPTIVGLLGEGKRLAHYRLDGIDLSSQLRKAKPRPPKS